MKQDSVTSYTHFYTENGYFEPKDNDHGCFDVEPTCILALTLSSEDENAGFIV